MWKETPHRCESPEVGTVGTILEAEILGYIIVLTLLIKSDVVQEETYF